MGVGLAFKGAAHDRLLGNWQAPSFDINDAWMQDGRTLAERSWDLVNNNPYARALLVTIIGGTFGSRGLEFRSLFSEDDDPRVSARELRVRRQINRYVAKVVAGSRPDAAGVMSWVDMHRALRSSARVTGDGIAVRLFKPGRAHAVAGTCWRIIESARVCNPDFGANTARMFEGFELDADGSPVAIHILNTHPNLMRYAERRVWVRVAIYADDGTRNVIHCRPAGTRPDQVRGLSEFSPVMGDLKHLDDLKLAWVVAKKAQASIAYFINTKDPARAAAADRNGAVINGSVGIKPLMKYYLGENDKIQALSFQYQGAEFDELLVSLLQGVSASQGLPVEMVLRRLTKTNLSASRAALLDYYQTCQREQDLHIEQAYRPMVDAIIHEGIARGEIDADGEDMDLVTAGRYLRPARVFPDPLKEAQAAEAWIGNGRSPSSVFAEAGFSYDDEIAQTRQDRDYAEDQGVDLSTEPVAERVVVASTEPVPAEGEPAPDEAANEDAPDQAPKPAAVLSPTPRNRPRAAAAPSRPSRRKAKDTAR